MTPDERHAQAVQNYSEHINPYLSKLMNFAGFGVEISASGCTITDHDGREFIDFLGGYGVFTLGHRHPKVVQAVKDQLDLMPLSGKTFFNEPQGKLAAKLAEVSPDGLDYVFFSNSGTEAVEAALKFAKATTKKSRILSTIGGYHGKTIGSLATSGKEQYRAAFEPLMPGVNHLPFGDLDFAKKAITDDVACLIVEPIQGEGGVILPPEGYLSGLRELCDQSGALLVIDEVQTGLGRTGYLFACERENVSPDIMTLAKALGGGVMPIGATLYSEKVNEGVYSENPLAHTSTFGGNQLSCVAGLAALDVIIEEDLSQRAHETGAWMLSEFKKLEQRDLVASVRGQGFILGIEFAMDEVGELVIGQMVKRGLIAAYTLNNKRVIRIEPPLIMEREMIEKGIEIINEAIIETEELISALA